MKNDILITTIILFSLSGCTTQIMKVPIYREVVVQHPEMSPTPTLINPQIRAVGSRELSVEAARSENSDKIYYILNQETLNALLLDDVEKLEYAQSETGRANFYKKVIEQFNNRVREINETTK